MDEKTGAGSAEPGRSCYTREMMVLGPWSWQREWIGETVSRDMKEIELAGLAGLLGVEADEEGISK